MTMEIIGDACAFIPGIGGKKNRYVKCGSAMRDSSNGRLSLKLDALPIAGWDGWINIFEREARGNTTPGTKPRPSFDDLDDDIPF